MSDSPFRFSSLKEHLVDFDAVGNSSALPEFPAGEQDPVVRISMLEHFARTIATERGTGSGAFGCFIAVRALVDLILELTLFSMVPEASKLDPLSLTAIFAMHAQSAMSQAESREQAERMAREAATVLVQALVETASQEEVIQIFADKIWITSQQSREKDA